MAGRGQGVQFQGGAPRYIADFSKALSSEVRILLQEVGELRDERRRLQQEIAELMAVKSKHGAGGDYSHEWLSPEMQRLSIEPPPAGGPPPPPPPADDQAIAVARPAWRTVTKKPEPPAPGAVAARRRARGAAPAAAAAMPPPPPPPPLEPAKPDLPSWAQWKPNPLHAPAPRHGAPQAMTSAPPRGGLFGPSTPPPQ